MKTNMRTFPMGIAAGAYLLGQDVCLEVDEKGNLVIPKDVKPDGFHLVVAVAEDSGIVVLQKAVGITGGDYESRLLSKLPDFAAGFDVTVMHEPIRVCREGKNVWTSWHEKTGSNRVDCLHVGPTGELWIFQVGVVTHDNGKTWRLHGEYRWRGWLYADPKAILIAKPEHPKWASFEGGSSNRTQLFGLPQVQALLAKAELTAWDGVDSDIDPPLPQILNDGQKLAVVDWFIPFAGQTGQGIVKNHAGKPAWVLGSDVEGFNPDDFEPQLWHGDVISYETFMEKWGSKNGPPRLLGVKLVRRG